MHMPITYVYIKIEVEATKASIFFRILRINGILSRKLPQQQQQQQIIYAAYIV